MKQENKILLGACLLITMLVLLSYFPAKDLKFVSFDDHLYVTDNLTVQKGITWEGIAWSFTNFHAANWHPLTWISHMLDYELYGLDPAGHHWTNVQFHLLNSILLFLFLFKSTTKLWQSLLVSILFAVHPMHVESVAWVAERKDVLSTFLGILMLMAYGRYVKAPGLFNYALIFIFLSLGLMAKPMLVTFPILLLLLDFWPFNRICLSQINFSDFKNVLHSFSSHKHLFVEKIVLFIPVAASCVLTLQAQGSEGAIYPLASLNLYNRFFNAFVSYIKYIIMLIFPSNLCIYYPHPINTHPFWMIFASIITFLGMTFIAIKMAKKFPFLFVGWLWFMVTLIPVIGLVQVGGQAMADRYTYIPSIGFFILCVWGVSHLKNVMLWRKYIFQSFAAVVVIIYSTLTFFQLGHWKNGIALWTRAINVIPEEKMAPRIIADMYFFMAVEYEFLNDDKNAILNYEKALAYNPQNIKVMNNLANMLKVAGKNDEALEYHKRVLSIKPNYVHAHNNIANAYSDMGNFSEAMDHYKKAIEIKPDYTEAHYNLGNLFFKTGKLKQAELYYQKALELNQDYAGANYNYAMLLKQQGYLNKAARHFAVVIKEEPENYKAFNEIGFIFYQKNMISKAIEFFEHSLSIKPDYKPALTNLKKIREKSSS